MSKDNLVSRGRGISVAGSVPVGLPSEGKGKAIVLLRYLAESGFELRKDMSGEFLVSIDHNEKQYRSFIQNGGSASKAILIRLEPISVFPSQYKESINSKYSTIFSPGHPDNVANGFGWPYQYHSDPNSPIESGYSWLDSIKEAIFESEKVFENWESREIEFSLIAGNKVSPFKDENYRIRRKIAHFMDPQLLHVYGPLWDNSFLPNVRHRLATLVFAVSQKTFPNIRSIYGDLFWIYPAAKGFVKDKHEILKKTKFAIVVENSNSYASEKLFDAMLDGCIPIYTGPELTSLGLPDSVAIQSKGDPADISGICNQITKREVIIILSSIDKFLKSNNFNENWVEKNVYSKISSQIIAKFKSAI